jgi:hypothetical protein
MDGELRPLGVWEIVEGGVRLFFRHWLAFMGAILVVIVPLQVLAAGVTWAVAPDQLEWNSSAGDGDDPNLLLWQGIVALIGFLTLLLVTAMSLKAVADARLGVTPSGGRSLRFALPRLPGTLAVAVLGGLAVALGFLALIVPGVWLAVGFSVAVPVLLLERTGPVASLRRSLGLVSGRWWATAGVLLLGQLLVGLVGALLQGIVMSIPASLAEGEHAAGALGMALGGTIATAFTAPCSAAIVTLLYMDLRGRKEHYTLGMLADAVGEAGERGAAAAPEPWPPAPGTEPAPPAPAAAPPPPGWLPPSADR